MGVSPERLISQVALPPFSRLPPYPPHPPHCLSQTSNNHRSSPLQTDNQVTHTDGYLEILTSVEKMALGVRVMMSKVA